MEDGHGFDGILGKVNLAAEAIAEQKLGQKLWSRVDGHRS